MHLTFMHRLTVFQEIQEEIFDCFSKITIFYHYLSEFIYVYL